MTDKRRVPQHLTASVRSGLRRNLQIREIVRTLLNDRVRDLPTIYAKLSEIGDITRESDEDWKNIETGTREAIKAWNAQQ